jgi:hypothetical protein
MTVDHHYGDAVPLRPDDDLRDDFAAELAEETDTWRVVDLGPALRGDVPAIVPTVLLREDGRGLFYVGQVNGIHGDSGTGKSWVALRAAVEQVRSGHHVVWIDAEDPNERTIVGRLRAVGLSADDVRERFHYISPQTAATPAAMRLLLTTVAAIAPTLVVLDSVGELFGLEGLDENKDTDVGPWMRRVARPIADLGPAVALVDHSTKAADNPLHASGSKRKRAAITGGSFLVEATTSLSKEHGGRLKLTCAKDRHGTYARGEHVASIDVNVYPEDDGVMIRVYPPSPKELRPELAIIFAARAAVNAAKKEGQPLSTNALSGFMPEARSTTKRAGIELAAARGFLAVTPGPRRSAIYEYVKDWIDQDTDADPFP